MPCLIKAENLSLSFGTKKLFQNLSFPINTGDKICLVGRNGSGKSSLFKLLSHMYEPDTGSLWQSPNCTIGYLPQSLVYSFEGNLKDFCDSQNQFELFEVEKILDPLKLSAYERFEALSGGQKRRVALAKTLLNKPQILLLDEPTNHLDLETIQWLENYIQSFKGACLLISHDRRFLENTTNKLFWLHQGNLLTTSKGYKYFDTWSEEILMLARTQAHKLESQISEEEARRISARRKQNQKRLRDLQTLRAQLQVRSHNITETQKKVHIDLDASDKKHKKLFDIHQVSFSYPSQKELLKNLNLTIMKGQKIGIIGNNGSGKTTFLKLLLKQLSPSSGHVWRAPHITLSYFDQSAEQLNLEKSALENLCPNGGDTIEVQGHKRNAIGYLKSFLFKAEEVHDKVQTFSGGQRNRLLLAKNLAQKADLLILDEPTNDLDLETLEQLQDILDRFTGSLLLVSHDRAFIDQTVTHLLAFEGDGKIVEVIGGYNDYLRQRHIDISKKKIKNKDKKILASPSAKPQRMSYKLKRELDILPERIESLEKKIQELTKELENPNLYQENFTHAQQITQDLVLHKESLQKAEDRWLELTEMAETYPY